MITSQNNGNKIIWNQEKKAWFYEDGKPMEKARKCPKCGKKPNKDGSDHCLGHLPGVINACCGHGGEGYIQFENGTEITFNLNSINHLPAFDEEKEVKKQIEGHFLYKPICFLRKTIKVFLSILCIVWILFVIFMIVKIFLEIL